MPRTKKFSDLHFFSQKNFHSSLRSELETVFFFEKKIVGRKFFRSRQNTSTLQEYIFLWPEKGLCEMTQKGAFVFAKIKAPLDASNSQDWNKL